MLRSDVRAEERREFDIELREKQHKKDEEAKKRKEMKEVWLTFFYVVFLFVCFKRLKKKERERDNTNFIVPKRIRSCLIPSSRSSPPQNLSRNQSRLHSSPRREHN